MSTAKSPAIPLPSSTVNNASRLIDCVLVLVLMLMLALLHALWVSLKAILSPFLFFFRGKLGNIFCQFVASVLDRSLCDGRAIQADPKLVCQNFVGWFKNPRKNRLDGSPADLGHW